MSNESRKLLNIFLLYRLLVYFWLAPRDALEAIACFVKFGERLDNKFRFEL